MAILTELQKQGIGNLIQDWPIKNSIDYDLLRPIDQFEPTSGYKGSDWWSSPYIGGFVLDPESDVWGQPKGPPLGLGKEYGADPFAYIRDLEKFQPEWTPGATEEGKLNKQIAETIGHEARHHLFVKNPELLEDMNITALGNNTNVSHEIYNYYLDMLAGGDTISQSDVYQDDRLRHYLDMKRPGEGRFGITGLENVFNKAKDKYLKFLEPKAGPQARALRPTPTYVSPARPHGDDRGSMPTGTAGRNPWGRADGGLATMFERR